MLTRLRIRNFRRLEEADIDLAEVVVLAGPNNSGKTAGRQVLCLWELGLRRWREKRSGHAAPGKRLGVPVSRRDFIAVPVPHADLLYEPVAAVRAGHLSSTATESSLSCIPAPGPVGREMEAVEWAPGPPAAARSSPQLPPSGV